MFFCDDTAEKTLEARGKRRGVFLRVCVLVLNES